MPMELELAGRDAPAVDLFTRIPVPPATGRMSSRAGGRGAAAAVAAEQANNNDVTKDGGVSSKRSRYGST